MDPVGLEDNESLDQLCGQVFLTTKGNIALQCCLCEVVFKQFINYAEHLNKHLIPTASAADLECLDGKNSPIVEEDRIEPLIKIEDELIIKDELDIDLTDSSEFLELDENERTHANEVVGRTLQSTELIVPNEFRCVKKRSLAGPDVIPVEERKYSCPICGLAFKNKGNMKYHLKRHSNQKEHECSDCGKRFHTTSEVRVHMRSHSLERKYICQDCGASFCTTTRLRNHMKRHTNQRDFICEICHKSFFEVSALRSHLRSHSVEKPFKCKPCQLLFSTQKALYNHLKQHENDRVYDCPICLASFNQKPGIFKHMETVHKVRNSFL